MFHGKPCQSRYGRFENDSYPISEDKSNLLSAALGWLGSEEHRNITWINTEDKEILFAYPFVFSKTMNSYVQIFGRPKSGGDIKIFEAAAKAFMKNFDGIREKNLDSNAALIHIFILRRIDRARTKVIYTQTADAFEIERQSKIWSSGSKNISHLRIGRPKTLFPLDAPDILNCFMKQNGDIVTDKAHPIPKYHGMELFFGNNEQWNRDLSVLVRNMEAIAPLLGRCISMQCAEKTIEFESICRSASLMGFLLLKLGIEKEKYMNDFAYLCGQLLKVSDELHIMYCRAVRDGDIPSQLVGGSMYMSVSDAPQRSLGVLGDRMNPYINWAKVYQYKNVYQENNESRRVGWLLRLYESYAGQLRRAMTENKTTHFTDAEKSQLFLGFIASFTKKSEANVNTENGGKENG